MLTTLLGRDTSRFSTSPNPARSSGRTWPTPWAKALRLWRRSARRSTISCAGSSSRRLRRPARRSSPAGLCSRGRCDRRRNGFLLLLEHDGEIELTLRRREVDNARQRLAVGGQAHLVVEADADGIDGRHDDQRAAGPRRRATHRRPVHLERRLAAVGLVLSRDALIAHRRLLFFDDRE